MLDIVKVLSQMEIDTYFIILNGKPLNNCIAYEQQMLIYSNHIVSK